MTIEETDDHLGTGLRVRRYRWTPEREAAGGVILLHGLGDHLLRYGHVAKFFVDRGYLCEGIDFPGHGQSAGQRGHIPRWEALGEWLDGAFGRLRGEVGGDRPDLGIFAHSMGGFVALDYLGRHSGGVSFAWLSAPLLQPGYGRSSWFLRLACLAGGLVPRVPFPTGVGPEDCVTEEAPNREEREEDPWMHHWTTLGFGRELLRREASVREAARSLPGDLDLLVTHGTEDDVCPYDLGREVFGGLTSPRRRFVGIEGERHEPLHGVRQGAVLEAAARWMDERRKDEPACLPRR